MLYNKEYFKKLSKEELHEYIIKNIYDSDDEYDYCNYCDICKKQQNIYCKECEINLCINCFYILLKCKRSGNNNERNKLLTYYNKTCYKLLCSHRLPEILYSRIIKSFN